MVIYPQYMCFDRDTVEKQWEVVERDNQASERVHFKLHRMITVNTSRRSSVCPKRMSEIFPM